LALALVVVSSGWGAPARADDVTPPRPSAPEHDQQFDALRAKVIGGGQLPVIVGVRAAFTPEGALAGPQAVQVQRAQIAQAQREVRNALAGVNATHIRAFEYIPYMALHVDAAALDALQRSPWVKSIAEDMPIPAALAESTVLIGAAGAGGVWAKGFTGAGWTVAILDTGVESSHPFLSGKVVAEACFSTNYSDGTYTSSTVCPNGSTSMTGTTAGRPCNVANPDPGDDCDHGTHVAGIAAGKDPGGPGFSGVAPDAAIIAVQVFSRFDSAPGCSALPCYLTWSSDQVAGLNFVYGLRTTFNIASANMSIGGGGPYSSPCDGSPGGDGGRKAVIDLLRSVGIATTISAGNNGFTNGLSSPACISTAVSVGSSKDGSSGATPVDTVSNFSNSASYLSLLAPGQWIESSIPGSAYALYQGTSMAAPHVAGAWAVLRQAAPGASVADTLAMLQNLGVSITDTRNSLVKKRIQLNSVLDPLLPRFVEGTSLNFGNVLVDLNVTRPLTLQNNLGISVTLSPSLSGADVSFLGGAYPGTGGTCGSSLAATQSCTIRLIYWPSGPGTLNGALGVTYDPTGAAFPATLTVTLSGQGREYCTDNLLSNAVFERSSVGWAESDTVGGNALPLCFTSGGGACSVGGYGPVGPYSGLGWGWFGGYTTTVPSSITQIISQSVAIPNGTASLHFNFHISRADPGTGTSDQFVARLDSTPIFTATAAEQSVYANYRLVRMDVNSFADGASHTLAFSSTTTTAAVVNFNLDDVALCSPAFYLLYLPIINR
jgi:subtilisin family serine protease